MNLDVLLQKIISVHGWPMVADPDGDRRVEVPTESGRSQVVQITAGRDPDGRPMAWIWSVVCAASAVSDPWYMLKENARLAYGALAVRGDNVLLVETQLVESADATEVARAIEHVARSADGYEKLVYGDADQR